MAKQKTPPGVTGATTVPTPIGVEPGYTATVPNDTSWMGVVDASAFNLNTSIASSRTALPRTAANPYGTYNSGDEWTPAGGNPDDIIALQTAMEAAGLYSGSYTKGVWQPVDAAAYAKVLATANGAGIDDKTALRNLVANPQVKEKEPRAPLTVHLTNPDDINELVDSFGNNLYGGNVPDATRQAIISAVQNSERDQQTSAYNMAETGGTVTEAPSAKTIADQQIRQTHPNEVAATQFADSFDTIVHAMSANTSGYQGINYP